jgi:beta-phosphoglucomutase-like phosphatase (HAD superfamily)
VIRAIVFDFDGVIADSEPLHFRAFRDGLTEHGLTLSEHEYYARYLGFSDADAFAAIGADQGRAWAPEFVATLVARKAVRLEELERDHSVLFPGAKTAIERLALACPLAIASGALGPEITRILAKEDLAQHFSAIVGADDTRESKPSPEPYRLAIQRLSAATGRAVRPEDCVAIEDSSWGLQSAKAAGLFAVGITHTYPAEKLALADAVLAHLDLLTWEGLCTLVQTRQISRPFGA